MGRWRCPTTEDKIKNPPASYKDLAKPEYKGHVAIFNLENNGGIITLLALAEANGGGATNVAPAFEFLKQIKPNLVATPAANPALVQLFQQNEATVAANWTGRILALQAEGFPIEMVVPSEGLYSGLTYVNVVKGAKPRCRDQVHRAAAYPRRAAGHGREVLLPAHELESAAERGLGEEGSALRGRPVEDAHHRLGDGRQEPQRLAGGVESGDAAVEAEILSSGPKVRV